jgi:prepilin-type N-terminal cleavage/methylation domain-containing protein
MKVLRNNKGFSLIELIITAVIINILAGVAIVAYIGTQEKARVAYVTRSASSATSELHLWMNASLSDNRHIREVDTNFSGVIENSDFTNGELLLTGVANTYINVRNTVLNEYSPWFVDVHLWNQDDPPSRGTISVRQIKPNLIHIIATERNGFVLYEQRISAN